MSYDLNNLKLNGTALGTVNGIKLNGNDLTGLKGIMLNGSIIIEFSGGGGGGSSDNRYEDCGPGNVNEQNYTFALVSDTQTRLDTNITDESNDPYIPYRGIAGLMRAGAYATQSAVGQDVDYADSALLDTFNLATSGSFGYPFEVSWQQPNTIIELHLKEQFDAVSSLNQDRAFISNFEAISSLFSASDGTCNDIYATATQESVLYDTTGQVGGVYSMSDGSRINVFTYNHASLWYQAGMETALRSWYDSSKGVLFVDVEDVYISMFLEGLNQNGTVNIDMCHKTSVSTNSQGALRNLLADGYDVAVPSTWQFKSDVDFGLVVTSMGIGTVLKEEPESIFPGTGSYGGVLWTIIANTNGMYGLLVDEFPCLQQYSYAKFDTGNQTVTYQFLGPIGFDLDPSTSNSFAGYATTYLHEIFPDFSSIGSYLADPNNNFNDTGFADFLVSTSTPAEITSNATLETAYQDDWYGRFSSVTFEAGENNVITSEALVEAANSCTYKGAEVSSLSA